MASFPPLSKRVTSFFSLGCHVTKHDDSKRFREIFLSVSETSGCKLHKGKRLSPQSCMCAVYKRSFLTRTASKHKERKWFKKNIYKSKKKPLISRQVKSLSGDKPLLYVWESQINVMTEAKTQRQSPNRIINSQMKLESNVICFYPVTVHARGN